MEFPTSPTNGQRFTNFGREYRYSSLKNAWHPVSIAPKISDIIGVDQFTTPGVGDILVSDGTLFTKSTPNITKTYQTVSELPLSGNVIGNIAVVSENNRVYLWTGDGWFSVALINTSPTITVGPDATYQLNIDGTPTIITLAAVDPEELPITWSYSVTSGSLGSTATVTQVDNVFTITPSINENDIGEFSITFTASDGINLATAVSSFTLAFTTTPADTNYNNSILIATSSTSGENNNAFIESSTNNFTVARNGNATQGYFSPYSPAGWSGHFDKNGDYLTVTSTDAVAFGTGDFTVEFWMNLNTLSGRHDLLWWGPSSSDRGGLMWNFVSNNLTYYISPTVASAINAAWSPTAGVWYHIALVRSSGSTKLYIDGEQAGSTYSDSKNYINGNIFIGKDVGSASYFSGMFADVRFVKGTAVYTTSFTPPTEPLTAITNTSLLTLQDNRFKDNSTNNLSINQFGDAKILAFSPYVPQVEYDPATHSGSAYFDGSGDYLSVASNNTIPEGNESYTIEAWFYFTGGTRLHIISWGGGSSNAATGLRVNDAGNGILHYWYANDMDTGNISLQKNAWNHVAAQFDGTTRTTYVNGVLAASGTPSGHNVTVTNNLKVGAGLTGSETMLGYICDLRVITGTAVYTGNFTPPTEPLTAVTNTSLLMNFTNAGIYDETGRIILETVGDITTSNTIVKYADTSMAFDGNGDRLTIPYTPMLSQVGAYTVEFWFYPTNSYSAQYIFARNAGNYFCLNWTGTTMKVDKNGVGVQITGSTTLALNQWHHYAMTYDGTTTRVFANGTLDGSVSGTGGEAVANTTIGYYEANTSSSFYGRISDFRFTRGVARYTTNFTPPTAKLGYDNDE